MQPKLTTVTLPDMFKSFLKEEPPVNPHYRSVKMESEECTFRYCSFNSDMRMKINKCDFSFFCSIAAPEAPRAKLRTLCDWGNWVFPYDDMFDNGHLRDDPEESERMMDSLMMPMMGKTSYSKDRPRIVAFHDTVVERMSKCTTPGVQRRFACAMRDYCRGALMQVTNHSSKRLLTLEEIVTIRRESAGCKPLYHLVEYAHDIQVPDIVFDHPIIEELENLGMDMVAISNDILSYRKEQVEGVPHNMVVVCRRNGMSTQQAFDTVGKLLDSRYWAWERAEAKLPSWGEETDVEVQKYIEAIKSVVKANLYWSFSSQRYLGPNAQKIRSTRLLDILADSPF